MKKYIDTILCANINDWFIMCLSKVGLIMSKFYTVKEFADLLRIHPNQVRKMIKKKRLNPINTATKKQPRYSIPEDDLLRLMSESFENSEV